MTAARETIGEGTIQSLSYSNSNAYSKDATRTELSCASTVVPGEATQVSRHDSPNSLEGTKEEAESPYDHHSEHNPSPSDLHLVESRNIISFSEDDSGNPYNWSSLRKAWIVLIGIFAVLNSTVGSAMPSEAVPQLAEHFHVTNQAQLVLPNSIYLAGYVLGPLLFGPLSERYGRQILMLGTFAGYTVFTLATCFSPNFAAFIIFRLLTGTFASAPISVTGGVYADLYDDPVTRGRAMAFFMAATSLGPSAAPTISGYLGPYGWRWPYWVLLMMTGTTWIFMVWHPETFGPTILQRRARRIRKEFPGSTTVAPMELEDTSIKNVITVVLTRPVRMFFGEAIVFSTCLYLAFVYTIQYLFFQAYPIIFGGIYNFTGGEQGLAFIPIGIGALVSCCIYLLYDHRLRAAQRLGKPWSLRPDNRRIPLACIGGPFITLGMFWIGWTARPSIHWILPTIGGLWFGMGYLILFIALVNHLVDFYEIYAASALAAASCSRSAFGAVLPFAAGPMFRALGVTWACSVLGFVSLVGCCVPFVFLRFGEKLQENSKFCQALRERKERLAEDEEAKRVRRQRRAESRASRGTNEQGKEAV